MSLERKTPPFFSIIIPVYNVELYLEECIESIMKQSCQDFEVIMVNDGSTDRSGSICDTYKEKYSFITVIHKINGGTASARNLGIQRASGKYLWFIDGDDWIVDNALETLKEVMLLNPIVSVCNFGKFEVIDDVLKVDTNDNQRASNGFQTHESKSFPIPSSVCYSIFKNEIFSETDVIFNENNYFEDEYFNLNLYCNHTFTILEGKIPLYVYRKFRLSSKTQTQDPQKIFYKCLSILDLFESIDKITNNQISRNTIELKKKFYLEIALSLFITYLNSNTVKKSELITHFRGRVEKIPISGSLFKRTQFPRILYNFNFYMFLFHIKVMSFLKL